MSISCLRFAKFAILLLKKQFKREQDEQLIKLDAGEFEKVEEKLLDHLLPLIVAEGFFGNEILKVAQLLDSWSYRQTEKAVKKVQRVTKKSMVPIVFDKDNPLVDDFMGSYVRNNIDLVASLGKEFIPGITDLASDTFLQGGSIKDLTKSFEAFTNGNVAKAEFWARDQVGTAYSEFTKIRQTQAGFNNYIWRTVGDNHVRGTDPKDKTSHVALEGRVFDWKVGASQTGELSNPVARHPGEDYSCRCGAEPTTREVTG